MTYSHQKSVELLGRAEAPTFTPCGKSIQVHSIPLNSIEVKSKLNTKRLLHSDLAEIPLGLQGVKIPGVGYVPCTVFRGVKYLSSHYLRGMRMMMKNQRKSLARNKFLNSLGSKTQKNAAMNPTAVATKVAANMAANIAHSVLKRIKLNKT